MDGGGRPVGAASRASRRSNVLNREDSSSQSRDAATTSASPAVEPSGSTPVGREGRRRTAAVKRFSPEPVHVPRKKSVVVLTRKDFVTQVMTAQKLVKPLLDLEKFIRSDQAKHITRRASVHAKPSTQPKKGKTVAEAVAATTNEKPAGSGRRGRPSLQSSRPSASTVNVEETPKPAAEAVAATANEKPAGSGRRGRPSLQSYRPSASTVNVEETPKTGAEAVAATTNEKPAGSGRRGRPSLQSSRPSASTVNVEETLKELVEAKSEAGEKPAGSVRRGRPSLQEALAKKQKKDDAAEQKPEPLSSTPVTAVEPVKRPRGRPSLRPKTPAVVPEPDADEALLNTAMDGGVLIAPAPSAPRTISTGEQDGALNMIVKEEEEEHKMPATHHHVFNKAEIKRKVAEYQATRAFIDAQIEEDEMRISNALRSHPITPQAPIDSFRVPSVPIEPVIVGNIAIYDPSPRTPFPTLRLAQTRHRSVWQNAVTSDLVAPKEEDNGTMTPDKKDQPFFATPRAPPSQVSVATRTSSRRSTTSKASVGQTYNEMWKKSEELERIERESRKRRKLSQSAKKAPKEEAAAASATNDAMEGGEAVEEVEELPQKRTRRSSARGATTPRAEKKEKGDEIPKAEKEVKEVNAQEPKEPSADDEGGALVIDEGNDYEEEGAEEPGPSMPIESPVKRGRGRPPKDPNAPRKVTTPKPKPSPIVVEEMTPTTTGESRIRKPTAHPDFFNYTKKRGPDSHTPPVAAAKTKPEAEPEAEIGSTSPVRAAPVSALGILRDSRDVRKRISLRTPSPPRSTASVSTPRAAVPPATPSSATRTDTTPSTLAPTPTGETVVKKGRGRPPLKPKVVDAVPKKEEAEEEGQDDSTIPPKEEEKEGEAPAPSPRSGRRPKTREEEEAATFVKPTVPRQFRVLEMDPITGDFRSVGAKTAVTDDSSTPMDLLSSALGLNAEGTKKETVEETPSPSTSGRPVRRSIGAPAKFSEYVSTAFNRRQSAGGGVARQSKDGAESPAVTSSIAAPAQTKEDVDEGPSVSTIAPPSIPSPLPSPSVSIASQPRRSTVSVSGGLIETREKRTIKKNRKWDEEEVLPSPSHKAAIAALAGAGKKDRAESVTEEKKRGRKKKEEEEEPEGADEERPRLIMRLNKSMLSMSTEEEAAAKAESELKEQAPGSEVDDEEGSVPHEMEDEEAEEGTDDVSALGTQKTPRTSRSRARSGRRLSTRGGAMKKVWKKDAIPYMGELQLSNGVLEGVNLETSITMDMILNKVCCDGVETSVLPAKQKMSESSKLQAARNRYYKSLHPAPQHPVKPASTKYVPPPREERAKRIRKEARSKEYDTLSYHGEDDAMTTLAASSIHRRSTIDESMKMSGRERERSREAALSPRVETGRMRFPTVSVAPSTAERRDTRRVFVVDREIPSEEAEAAEKQRRREEKAQRERERLEREAEKERKKKDERLGLRKLLDMKAINGRTPCQVRADPGDFYYREILTDDFSDMKPVDPDADVDAEAVFSDDPFAQDDFETVPLGADSVALAARVVALFPRPIPEKDKDDDDDDEDREWTVEDLQKRIALCSTAVIYPGDDEEEHEYNVRNMLDILNEVLGTERSVTGMDGKTRVKGGEDILYTAYTKASMRMRELLSWDTERMRRVAQWTIWVFMRWLPEYLLAVLLEVFRFHRITDAKFVTMALRPIVTGASGIRSADDAALAVDNFIYMFNVELDDPERYIPYPPVLVAVESKPLPITVAALPLPEVGELPDDFLSSPEKAVMPEAAAEREKAAKEAQEQREREEAEKRAREEKIRTYDALRCDLNDFLHRRPNDINQNLLNKSVEHPEWKDVIVICVCPHFATVSEMERGAKSSNPKCNKPYDFYQRMVRAACPRDENFETSIVPVIPDGCSVAEAVDAAIDYVITHVRHVVRSVRKRVVLMGWGMSCYINHRVVQHCHGVAAIINFAFPLWSGDELGYRGCADDDILLTYCPTLFVMGSQAEDYSPVDMFMMRKSFVQPSGLVIVGDADENLMVECARLQRERITQRFVGRCVLELAIEFVNMRENRLEKAMLQPLPLNDVFHAEQGALRCLNQQEMKDAGMPAVAPVRRDNSSKAAAGPSSSGQSAYPGASRPSGPASVKHPLPPRPSYPAAQHSQADIEKARARAQKQRELDAERRRRQQMQKRPNPREDMSVSGRIAASTAAAQNIKRMRPDELQMRYDRPSSSSVYSPLSINPPPASAPIYGGQGPFSSGPMSGSSFHAGPSSSSSTGGYPGAASYHHHPQRPHLPSILSPAGRSSSGEYGTPSPRILTAPPPPPPPPKPTGPIDPASISLG